jgi:hypothetical protein
MSLIPFIAQPTYKSSDAQRSKRILEKSAGATLVEVGATIAGVGLSHAIPGLCSRCRSDRNLQSSTAQHPEVFCSAQCELEFIRIALASITLEDCVRMHQRLESLLGHSPRVGMTKGK